VTHRTTYCAQSEDTAEWADRMQFSYWGSLSLPEKAAIFSDLCAATQRLSLLGLSLRHPGASAEELDLRQACLRLGRETVERVLGHSLPFPD